MKYAALALGLAVLQTSVAHAETPPTPFAFTPIPRWSEEPETENLCAAIRAECGNIKDVTNIDTEFGYDEIYDANLQLVGVRMTKSTGCKPLDESELLSRRHFRLMFHALGKPDLDGDLRVEMQPGTNASAIRVVKASSTQISLGCNPH